ncbi:MAG: nitroreductase family protein [Spirochaetes bacterium]|jgi:nitroreductase|nr:nitroreductase family protein [Spirochaetota bacterium]
MEFHELLMKRRSIRDFQDKEVPAGIIRQIITKSRLAPSSGNGQPREFNKYIGNCVSLR